MVEISLYIIKYNIYTFHLKKIKNKNVNPNLEYYWILKKRWILKKLKVAWDSVKIIN